MDLDQWRAVLRRSLGTRCPTCQLDAIATNLEALNRRAKIGFLWDVGAQLSERRLTDLVGELKRRSLLADSIHVVCVASDYVLVDIRRLLDRSGEGSLFNERSTSDETGSELCARCKADTYKYVDISKFLSEPVLVERDTDAFRRITTMISSVITQMRQYLSDVEGNATKDVDEGSRDNQANVDTWAKNSVNLDGGGKSLTSSSDRSVKVAVRNVGRSSSDTITDIDRTDTSLGIPSSSSETNRDSKDFVPNVSRGSSYSAGDVNEIAKNSIDKDVAKNEHSAPDRLVLRLDEDWCVPTIFGHLVGYPVVYWYSASDHDPLCRLPLTLYSVDAVAHTGLKPFRLWSFSVPASLAQSVRESVCDWHKSFVCGVDGSRGFTMGSLEEAEVITDGVVL